MYIQSLVLSQFRNYKRVEVSLSPGLNLFVGPNGAGKSNLLEAVAVLATGQSHRGSDNRHLIQWECTELGARACFDGEDRFQVEMRHKARRPRHLLVDNQTQKRLSDWVGRVPIVSFSPDDLYMVKGEPSLRRRALNETLCQLDKDYAEALQRYQKIVTERNAALRRLQEGNSSPSLLDPWDVSLLKEGVFLSKIREKFIETFSEKVNQHHHSLSSAQEEIRLVYKASLHLEAGDPEAIAQANRQRIQDKRAAEIALGSTLIGPHRDDVEFWLNNNLARTFASQGQQRTLALALKLAEQDLLSHQLRKQPLCLLDDVLSELDGNRKEKLAEALTQGSQCLVTLTDRAEWPGAVPQPEETCLFQVGAGQVESLALEAS